jgi:hypothetical protein
VLLPDGLTPAAQTIVTLRFQSQSQLQSGVLQLTTGIGGTFEFSGIPLGTFSLSAFELVSSGVRNLTGSLTANGQHVALGDIVLDNAGPRVIAIEPADGATGVAANAAISITFNEPIDPATLMVGGATGNLALLHGNVPVALGAPVLSNENRTVRLQPVQPLSSAAQYLVSIKGAPDGPKDEAAIPLADPFVSTFAVLDGVPPAVLSISPANEAAGVLPEAVVRITFSEPVATAAAVLRNGSGTVVPGITGLTNGNTVLVFSPQDFLQPNTFYTVTLSAVADTAGNPLGAFATRFFTVDTLAPIITALQIAGTARAGATISVQPVVNGADTARVEFRTTQGVALVSTSAPFAVSFALPVSETSTTISAIAIDLTGNRSAVFEQALPIQSNAAPVVTLTNLAGVAEVSQGQNLTFQVRATDDADLAQILFSAVGAATASNVQPVAAGQADVTTTFDLQVPQTAPSGETITVQAAAIDGGGLQTAAAPIVLSIRDALRPVVTILAPVNNAVVVPDQSIDVIVDSSDDVALASVALVCNPASTGCETRLMSAGTAATRQTFTVTIPASLQAPQTITLSVITTDTAGNTGTAARVLQIADALKPTITAVQPVSGSTQVVAGTIVALRASVADNVGVTALLFATEGALVTSDTAAVVPSLTSGDTVFSMAVPDTVPNGSTITVRVRARDAASNLSDEASIVLTVGDAAPPVVTFLEPVDGGQVSPGQSLTVRIRATDDTAVRRVNLTVTGVLALTDTREISPASTPVDVVFTVPVPVGTQAGQITLTAEAVDAAGSSSTPAQRSVTVRDVLAPQVRILSPAASALVDPRQPIQVSVEATDAVGVTQIAFSASGAISVSESRTIDPAAGSRTETFTVTFIDLPSRGGTLTLSASARDAAGNEGTATAVAVNVQDVVGPSVTAITPIDSASNVSELAQVIVQFSEPVDPADINATNVRLASGGVTLAATLTLSDSNEVLTIAPASPLALSAVHTVTVGNIRDVPGNVMAGPFASTFTTRAPDADSPRVSSIDPTDGESAVALTKPVTVTFSEPIDRASVTSTSFRVTVNGGAAAGALVFSNGDRSVRFVPADPWPAGATIVTALSGEITDTSGHALVDAQGGVLTTPMTFSFTTATFGITSPKAGSAIVENSRLTLEARGSSSLGLASVTFTVNGEALAAVSGPNFVTTFDVPAAAVAPALTIEAVGRDSAGAVVATDELVANVVTGLKAEPRLIGIKVGGTARVTLRLSSPAAEDLPLTLEAVDPAIVSFPETAPVLRAGETQLQLSLSGMAVGATTVLAQSSMGTAAVIVSVSDVTPGQDVSVASSVVAANVVRLTSIAHVFIPIDGPSAIGLRLFDAPATEPILVEVVSSDPAVVSVVSQPTIQAGSQVAELSLAAGQAGTATLTITAGGVRRTLTVVVGGAPTGVASPVVAQIAGASVQTPGSIGHVFTVPETVQAFGLKLLKTPRTAITTVQVSSSDTAVVSLADGVVQIPAGSLVANLALTTGQAGTALLTLVIDGVATSLTVFVGPPPAAVASPVIAQIAGVSVLNVRSIGQVFATPETSPTLGIRLLSAASGAALPVQITSSNPAVVNVAADVQIAAGSLIANIPLTIGQPGTAVLAITIGGSTQTLTVTAGPPPGGVASPVIAQPVGITIIPNVTIGTVGAPAVGQHTFGLRLLAAPAPSEVPVTISSSNPAIADVSGPVSVEAGQQVAPITLLSTAEGVATLAITAAGQTRHLTIVIGAAAASQLPAVIASPASVSVIPDQPTGAVLIMPVSSQSTIGVPLLSSDAAVTTPVTISSTNEAIASALIAGDIPAGSRTATLTIQSGQDGIALLTVTVNGQSRTLPVLVGTASAGQIPAVIAPITSIEIKQE